MSGLILQRMASAPGTADRCLNSKSKVKVPRDCSVRWRGSCGSQHTPGCMALPRHTLHRPALFPLGLVLLALLCISLLGEDPRSSQGKTAGVLQFVYLVLGSAQPGHGKTQDPISPVAGRAKVFWAGLVCMPQRRRHHRCGAHCSLCTDNKAVHRARRSKEQDPRRCHRAAGGFVPDAEPQWQCRSQRCCGAQWSTSSRGLHAAQPLTLALRHSWSEQGVGLEALRAEA